MHKAIGYLGGFPINKCNNYGEFMITQVIYKDINGYKSTNDGLMNCYIIIKLDFVKSRGYFQTNTILNIFTIVFNKLSLIQKNQYLASSSLLTPIPHLRDKSVYLTLLKYILRTRQINQLINRQNLRFSKISKKQYLKGKTISNNSNKPMN